MRPLDVGDHLRAARLECDRTEDPGWRVLEDGEPKEDVTFCWIGTRMLPVVSAVDAEPASSALAGTLRALPERAGAHTPWIKYLREDAELDARSYDVYLVRDGDAERRREIALAAAYVFLTGLGWVFWIRAYQRRRRARHAAA